MNSQKRTPKTYSILCTARQGKEMGIEQLAMTDKSRYPRTSWTSDDPEMFVKFYSKHHVDKVCERLQHNQPVVVDYWEAIDVVRKQAESIVNYKLDEQLAGA